MIVDYRMQLKTQLLQLRKESLKKTTTTPTTGLYGIRTLGLCDTGAALLS